MAELQRASVFAIKRETTVGDLIAPSLGSDAIPLREGFSQTSAIEELVSDELVNDIGATKSLTGLESPEGSHPAYLKHSEVEGTAPEVALLFESAFGAVATAGAEFNTVAASTAGTSTARPVIKVDTGEGASYQVGEALLIKDGTNGYSIRNIHSISGDDLTGNFNLDVAPGTGVNLGRATLFHPVATGHPSYSAWLYGANGGYIQAMAGCRTSEIAMTFPAGEQATVDFSYQGTESFFNPVIVTASNEVIDFEDDGGVKVANLTVGIYKSPVAFAAHVQAVMDAASVDVITCAYNSQTGKYTIASDGTTFELQWNTGPNTASSAAVLLGDTTAADRTGATSYTSTNAMDLAFPFTAAFDNATNIVVKGAQLFVGSHFDNVCRAASEVSFTMGTPQEVVESICSDSGVSERLITSREVTMEATLILPRYEADLFDKFINNKDAVVMMNAGQKDSSGNWVPGKCVNVYFPQSTLTQHETGGDTIVELTLSAKGYISGTRKDVYLNFI
jgi:hypothetical protein